MHIKREQLSEMIRYGFWGVITILFSMGSYTLLSSFLEYKLSNFISIVMTKTLAYLTNRKFVFKTKTQNKEQLVEIIKFILARGFTGIVDWIGLILLVELLLFNDKYAKLIMIIITTVLNYLLGKKHVFTNNDTDS